MDVNYEEIKISKKDVIPTYIENNKFSEMGEDLIKIYDVPSTKDKDPSTFVLFAFAYKIFLVQPPHPESTLYLLL